MIFHLSIFLDFRGARKYDHAPACPNFAPAMPVSCIHAKIHADSSKSNPNISRPGGFRSTV